MRKEQVIAKIIASSQQKKKKEGEEKRFNAWLCRDEIAKILAAQKKEVSHDI